MNHRHLAAGRRSLARALRRRHGRRPRASSGGRLRAGAALEVILNLDDLVVRQAGQGGTLAADANLRADVDQLFAVDFQIFRE
jgi:hypothetical protein